MYLLGFFAWSTHMHFKTLFLFLTFFLSPEALWFFVIWTGHLNIFEISRKAVSATRNDHCTQSECRCERINTLINVIMAGTIISPLQYVGCINGSGTVHAYVKRDTKHIKWPKNLCRCTLTGYFFITKLCVGEDKSKKRRERAEGGHIMKQTIALFK